MPPARTTFPTLTLFDHPLIQHKLGELRDRDTSFRQFRAVMAQVAGLMLFEATRTLPIVARRVDTPLESTETTAVAGAVTIVPILRAGLAMADGVLDLMPEARVGHIGLFRDEATFHPTTYLSRLPRDLDAGPVILLDPMLATGGSAVRAATLLKEAGGADIRFMCIVAAPPGVERFADEHPDVQIYAASLDHRLNDQGFIVPGLGDAGDRMYGTLGGDGNRRPPDDPPPRATN
jgi:uracil phosphoribosyltransferase